MNIARPRGVTALAIGFIIYFVAGITAVYLIWNVLEPSYNNMMNMYFYLGIIMFAIPLTFYFPFITLIISSALPFFYAMGLVAWFFLVSSGLCLIAGVGLLYMKKWGYYLALIIGILVMAPAIGFFTFPFAEQNLVLLVGLIFGGVIVYYLVGDVKHKFE